jgi:hypothetical protein
MTETDFWFCDAIYHLYRRRLLQARAETNVVCFIQQNTCAFLPSRYELSNHRGFISGIRLAQDDDQDSPSTTLILLDDPTSPVCVDSQPTSVDPTQGY